MPRRRSDAKSCYYVVRSDTTTAEEHIGAAMAIFDKKQDLPAAEKQHSARTVLVNQRLSVIVRQCTELGACVAANGSREGQRRVSVLHAFGFDEGTKACEPVKAYSEKFYQNCTEGSVSWFCSRIAVARNRADFSFLSLLVFMFFLLSGRFLRGRAFLYISL